MEHLEFTKMMAAGNDFIVIDNRTGKVKGQAPKLAQRLCDRKNGIGADGLLLLERSEKSDLRMRIFNPDGSQAEMCGNGVRCLAKFSADRKISASRLSVETPAGEISVNVRAEIVRARLSDPKGLKISKELSVIDTGVPHAVKFVQTFQGLDVEGLGRQIRHDKAFKPRGTNVDFVRVVPGNRIEVRTYERGVEAETLSCGTGSTASALVAAKVHNLKSPVEVKTQSGEILKVHFLLNGKGFHEVTLEGEVREVFQGKIKS